MSDHADGQADVPQLPAGDESAGEDDPCASVERYDADDGVVFYDAQNPLAWLKATNAVCLDEME